VDIAGLVSESIICYYSQLTLLYD